MRGPPTAGFGTACERRQFTPRRPSTENPIAEPNSLVVPDLGGTRLVIGRQTGGSADIGLALLAPPLHLLNETLPANETNAFSSAPQPLARELTELPAAALYDLFLDAADISTNQLVILVPKDNPHDIRDLANLGNRALKLGVRDSRCKSGPTAGIARRER